MHHIASLVLVLGLTLLSGLLDARGFVYASRAWPGGSIDLRHASLSVLCFVGGLSMYIVAVRFMQTLGVGSVALQSAVWFGATAIALALFDGSIGSWSRTQQAVALVVAAGLAWLIVTTQAAKTLNGGP